MGLYYSDLIPVLIKAIQEQQAQIDELKPENNKNISDFGVASLTDIQTFIPFSNEFKNMISTTPVVTATPINTSASLSIISQNSEGFIVRINGEFSAIDFNWIAMAKIK